MYFWVFFKFFFYKSNNLGFFKLNSTAVLKRGLQPHSGIDIAKFFEVPSSIIEVSFHEDIRIS